MPVMIGSSRFANRRKTPERLQRTRRRRAIFLFIFILLVLPLLTAAWAFLIEPALLTVTRYSLSFENLPEHWEGRTIVFFTDTHLGEAYGLDRLSRAADAIMAEQPDLILFGGDLIDSRTPHQPEFAAGVSRILAGLKAPFGQYAVAGNHDNRLIAEYRFMSGLLQAGGFTLLDNHSVIVDGIWLAGLAESYFGRPDLDRAFSREGLIASAGENEDGLLAQDLFRLLLMHQPDDAAALPDDSASLTFSGHSHNGQVTFFGKPIITVYAGSQYPYGHYQLSGQRSLIVSRGLGTVGIPARLGAPPEIVVVTLRRS